jgi:hypothetical protein
LPHKLHIKLSSGPSMFSITRWNFEAEHVRALCLEDLSPLIRRANACDFQQSAVIAMPACEYVPVTSDVGHHCRMLDSISPAISQGESLRSEIYAVDSVSYLVQRSNPDLEGSSLCFQLPSGWRAANLGSSSLFQKSSRGMLVLGSPGQQATIVSKMSSCTFKSKCKILIPNISKDDCSIVWQLQQLKMILSMRWTHRKASYCRINLFSTHHKPVRVMDGVEHMCNIWKGHYPRPCKYVIFDVSSGTNIQDWSTFGQLLITSLVEAATIL